MYHPAAALHQPALRDSILADFASLPRYLDLARTKEPGQVDDTATTQSAGNLHPGPTQAAESPSQPEDNPEQLSLF
jgi:DNA polymerase